MTTTERLKVVKTIRAIWDSLESHLPHAVEAKANCASCGSRKFHANTIREYAQQIKDLSEVL